MGYKELKAGFEMLTEENKQLRAKLKPQPKVKCYTYKEAADIFHISVEGLKSRIRRGQVKKICNGNRPLIADTEIIRFLQAQNPDDTDLLQRVC